MKEKLSTESIISISLMLFAMFFGAGNMIFPPALGQAAGENFFPGILGFMVTDAGLSFLGIAAIVLAGTKLDDLAGKVGPKFAILAGVVVYMLIGPLFALPRTGTVSFELAAVPFLPEGSPFLPSLIFTAVFFILTYFLCLNPSKLVDIVGKILTPLLLLSIAVIFAGCLIHAPGPVGEPAGDYAHMPFFRGLLEGYLALDGLAALAFAIAVINAIKSKGVTEPKNIAKYTIIAGILASLGLGVAYLALGYAGAVTSTLPLYENGGKLLASLTNMLFGSGGNIILGAAVLLACLTTSIGLASSFADYFQTILPRYSYKKILLAVCLFSFIISNVGLTLLIQFTAPALNMIYPPAIALVILSFFDKWITGKPEAYALALLFSFIVGVLHGLYSLKVFPDGFASALEMLPGFALGIGWILPAVIGALLGRLSFVTFLSKK